MEGLIGGQFVIIHLSTPETFPVKTDIPVAQVVTDEILDHPAGQGDVVVLISCLDLFLEGVEQGDDPSVNFGSR